MLRNLVSLGASTLIRALVGFVLFVLIARHWGASLFGEFMYFFAVAALLVQVCEYGFSQQILREVGADPDHAAARMAQYFAAKVWLTLTAWLAAGAFLLSGGIDDLHAMAFILLLAAGTFMSYSDLLMSCFRATGRYSSEARITLFGNVIYLAGALGALYLGGNLVVVAAAFAAGRLIHLIIAASDYRRHMPQWIAPDLRLTQVVPVVWRGGAYGLNVALGTVMINLDSVLIAHTLGFAATGEYQAAARFYQGAALLPPIFAGVFLPSMARAGKDISEVNRLAAKVNLAMLVAGIGVAACFVFGPYWYTWIYSDPSLASVGEVLPWFGGLALVAYVASAQGISVTALGGQSMRAAMLVAALVMMLVSAGPLMAQFGVAGMVIALTLAYALLSISFWIWNSRQGILTGKAWGLSFMSIALVSVLIVKFLG